MVTWSQGFVHFCTKTHYSIVCYVSLRYLLLCALLKIDHLVQNYFPSVVLTEVVIA